MNVFRQYTLRSLKANRTRTLVTIIGIILSVALFTAVTEGAYSGQQFMIHVQQEHDGAFQAFYTHMQADEAAQLAGDPEITAWATFDSIGYAKVSSKNKDKPYLYVAAASEQIADLLAIHITQGRMPQNGSEILLPLHLYTNGNVKTALGDTLALDLGARQLNGQTLDQYNAYTEGEQLQAMQQKTYTVVGYYERLNYDVEDFSSPGYTALTGGQGSGDITAFITVAHPIQIHDYLENTGRSANYRTNEGLLYYYGTSGDNSMLHMLYGLMAILLGLIMFGSVALIYNSFSISVSERTQQFGLLKSIGATRRQIRRTVLFEALYLCAIAIPLGLIIGCVGIGITLRCLSSTFTTMMNGISTVQMRLVLTVWPLVISASIGLVTALISAWIPARRAMRLSAIDAIRQTSDIRIKGKQVKTAKLTYRLFGFEGALASKNFKRNRKKYRSTVISLFLSVVLFIAASAFCLYLTKSVQGSIRHVGFDIIYHSQQGSDLDPDLFLQQMQSISGVESATYFSSCSQEIRVKENQVDKTYLKYFPKESDTASTVDVSPVLYFVNDSTFLQLLQKQNLDKDAYLDAAHPQALLYDDTQSRIYTENGSYGITYATLQHNTVPLQVDLIQVGKKEGYQAMGSSYDEQGNKIYNFLDSEIANGNKPQKGETDGWIDVPAQEVEQLVPLQIGAVLTEQPFFLSDSFVLIYPASAQQTILGQSPEQSVRTSYVCTTQNHAQVYNAMLTQLQEQNLDLSGFIDMAADLEANRAIITVVRVFAYGFIALISLIAAANVFNTISTNISLRRRELAMLTSVGMTRKGFRRMMNYECLLYGCKALLYGLPVSLGVCWLIYRAVNAGFEVAFSLPWSSIAVAVISVFVVVFATMLYATAKLKKRNPIDTLRCETI